MIKRIKDSSFSFLFLSLFCFVLLAMMLSWVYGPYVANIYNSDLSYIESLFHDFFTRDYPLSGWLVSRAPFFFPDWVLYFVLRALTGSYGVAWYLYLVVNLGFLITFFYGIVRLFYGKESYKNLLYCVSWGALLILLLKQTPEGYGVHTFI